MPARCSTRRALTPCKGGALEKNGKAGCFNSRTKEYRAGKGFRGGLPDCKLDLSSPGFKFTEMKACQGTKELEDCDVVVELESSSLSLAMQTALQSTRH